MLYLDYQRRFPMKKEIKNLADFLRMLVECQANNSDCITIPKSTAVDIIEYIELNEKYLKGK
jgi:hypothetical protein